MEKKNDKLTVKYGLVWDKLSKKERDEAMKTGEDYKKFIDAGKTERLCVRELVRRAEAEGFKNLDSVKKLKPGDKVYSVNRGKSAVLAVIGKEPVKAGVSIVGSHIDSPRIDLKQNPLYEEGGMALLKTHYYGGIRKYQWVARPLALYGVVILADGKAVEIAIGDEPGDPVFYITDLLPHLAADQSKKTLNEGIAGEALNAIIGTLPEGKEEDKDRFKQAILQLLNDKYGMVEEDFVSAELELVPAGAARDVGLDRGSIAAYGHDDRVCAYTSMKALFESKPAAKTAIALFVDKEEVSSQGNTSMNSRNFANTVGRMIELQEGTCTGFDIDRALALSALLSSDVAAAFDPNYPSVSETRNNAYLGKGVTIVKYTGSRGKSGSNDANAEFVGEVRRVLNAAGVVWQTSELGKVDQGGGGTIAYILANCDMDVLDIGVPVLAMHAPFELVSKADVYMTYKAYKAFYESR
ncbi:MAG: aminopeptidase [Clostridia bacterium]|nr:aminopeptidase [Clostridia bacterium]